MKHIRPTSRQLPTRAQRFSDPYWDAFFRMIDLLIWLANAIAKL